jgi:uroporphyrinogen-III decarboxylase
LKSIHSSSSAFYSFVFAYMCRYPDDNARVYKTVPLAIPTGAAPPALTAQAAAADAIANDEALEVAKAKEKSARQAAIRARPTGNKKWRPFVFLMKILA